MKKIIFCLLFFTALFWIKPVLAEDNWYIKDYKSQFVLSKDSTMAVSEKIVADCGMAPNKHGIFRIVPLFYQKTTSDQVKTPIYLSNISNFEGKKYTFDETINKSDKTITWKIGEVNKIVTGVNNYQIDYSAKNLMRFDNPKFDEFYWNLNGNFWDMTTDKYSSTIIFPTEISSANTEVNLYNGQFGTKDENLASYRWEGNNLIVESKSALSPKTGITVSVTVPKNIFTAYSLTTTDEGLYQTGLVLSKNMKNLINILGLIFLIIVFFICYRLWSRYGKDPKINRAIAPEFEIPENLTPIDMGMIDSNGVLKNHFISATIINLAVNGYIQIEMIGKTNIFSHEDYKLKKTGKNIDSLNVSEKLVLDLIFGDKGEINISSLKNSFYTKLPQIKNSINQRLISDGMVQLTGNYIRIAMMIIAFGIGFGGILLLGLVDIGAIGVILGAIIIFIFGIFMPARTQRGSELELRIKGFKMYMETAEKYRQQFNEKENIMEKFLPYAIMFQMTKEWIKKMRDIYGEEYFNSYTPLWLHGAMLTNGHFDINHLTETINSMSSDMASTMASSPSSSGSGGGGFSGGGGGGGGGGGW